MTGSEHQVRTFVAVDLGVAARRVLQETQVELRRALAGAEVRWTRPEQLHLTLAFLGNLDSRRLPDLVAALTQALHATSAFQLELSHPGAFPSFRAPRVLWVGLGGEIPALLALQLLVARAAGPFGEHEETRAFQPHLTIGRVARWDASSARVLEAAWSPTFVLPASPWKVGGARLMRSVLGREGATHSELARFDLA